MHPMKFVLHFSSRWLLYFLASSIVLLSLYTIVGDRGAIHLWRLQGEKEKLDEQNHRLHKENEALRQRIFRLRNDDSYLETIAREELNLVRPGEIIYRFSSPDSLGKRSRTRANQPAKAPSSDKQKSRR